MELRFSAFDHAHKPGASAAHPLTRLGGRVRFSLVVAGMSLPPSRFALKYADSLWAEAVVESYAAATRPGVPSGPSNRGFQV